MLALQNKFPLNASWAISQGFSCSLSSSKSVCPCIFIVSISPEQLPRTHRRACFLGPHYFKAPLCIGRCNRQYHASIWARKVKSFAQLQSVIMHFSISWGVAFCYPWQATSSRASPSSMLWVGGGQPITNLSRGLVLTLRFKFDPELENFFFQIWLNILVV